jgi:lipopolysaccharide export system protein LptA
MKKIISVAVLVCVMAAAAQAALPVGGKHDANAPIEINADALEVLQQENKATFSGNVVAVQGDTRLKSDKMVVYYHPQEEKQTSAGQQDAIRKIDVIGNVFLAMPEETASGKTGLYDVENQRVELHENVVVTHGKNTLKGDKLVYDMKTGKSVVTSGGAVQNAPWRRERVRALFVPDKKPAAEKKP